VWFAPARYEKRERFTLKPVQAIHPRTGRYIVINAREAVLPNLCRQGKSKQIVVASKTARAKARADSGGGVAHRK
jgi:hypothetical protein